MALHDHNGKTYCDVRDLEALLPRNTLYRYLSRARKYGGSFQNIANPFFNNRNSRRWVLLKSLPPDLRKQVESHLRIADKYHEEALKELGAGHASSEEIALTSTQITSEAVPQYAACLERAPCRSTWMPPTSGIWSIILCKVSPTRLRIDMRVPARL